MSRLLSLIVLLLVGLTRHGINSAKNPYLDRKPDFLHTCKFSDPEFIKCSTRDVQGMFTQIGKGMPEIGLTAMDPFYIEKLAIAQGDGPVNIDISARNLTVIGMKDAVVVMNDVDSKTYEFRTKIYLKKMVIRGNYKATGKILVVPIKGQGESLFDIGDITIDSICDVGLVKKKNHYFYDVKAVHVDFHMKSLKIRLTNLFDGHKELEQGTHAYLNGNWREVSEVMKPIFIETIESILLRILKQFFDQVPADYFVSDIK